MLSEKKEDDDLFEIDCCMCSGGDAIYGRRAVAFKEILVAEDCKEDVRRYEAEREFQKVPHTNFVDGDARYAVH